MSIYSSYALRLLLVMVFISGCIHKVENRAHQTQTPFFDPIGLGAYNQSDSLSIVARFSECGEWGGHKEHVIIRADSTLHMHARYRVYPFNCDSLEYYYNNEELRPTVDKEVVLNEQRKKSVTDYILRLTQSKISERFPGHAGNSFSVVHSDSTLVIEVYNNNEYDVSSFKRLVAELF